MFIFMAPIACYFASVCHASRVAGFLTRDLRRTARSRVHGLASISKAKIADDDASQRREDDCKKKKTSSLLWLSPNRLRLKDNLALSRAAELGPDGLAICLLWPHNTSSSFQKEQLTPVQAFGFVAANSLNDTLGELGQKLLFIPSEGEEETEHYDPLSMIYQAVQILNPTYVVVDVCLLDRHHNHASKLRDKLQNRVGENENNTSVVIEVLDDGLLIPYDKVPKALGRSRQGGRILRWSTFLSNTMAMEENDLVKPTWSLSTLPPPLKDAEVILPTSPISTAESFPSWARQLLAEWGDVSEDEAMIRASKGNNIIDNEKSSLTEKGSKDTKLSPYLRWGMISPQRAAMAGVRRRDLLWRDWSYVCYSLLGPLRRGDAVLDFMDKPSVFAHDELKIEEEELFRLWCVGNTGVKMVDAGMRQLWLTGWMPRKLRLLSAACLVEGLGINWRKGRDWFGETLIDHDPAINEIMWQNSGFCGVDPFYSGVAWEAPPKSQEEEEYVKRWSHAKLTWPSLLQQYSIREPPLQIFERAEPQRNALRERGVYKAARTVANSGVRVAWPGLLSKSNNDDTNTEIREGEVMGVGLVPIHKLEL